MAYNTKYILNYCNAKRVPLRIELQVEDYVGEVFLIVNNDEYVLDHDDSYVTMNVDGTYDPLRDMNKIEGSQNPFSLTFQNDTGEKNGTIRATYATMSFFEDLMFNIDDLATSDETAIRCVFYFDNEIEWIGYVTPDFFNVPIEENPVINLTASDRIGILKDIEYEFINDDSDIKVDYISIISSCLQSTGLDLNINVLCDFFCSEFFDHPEYQTHCFYDTFVSEFRFVDGENKIKDKYSILKAICDQFNCFITQYRGEWWIVNKEQLEIGNGEVFVFDYEGNKLETYPFAQGEITFSLIDTGGERTIIPVSSITTILANNGDTQIYPKNSNLLADNNGISFWSIVNSPPFIFGTGNLLPVTYLPDGQFEFETMYEAEREFLFVKKREVFGVWLDLNEPHLKSSPVKIVSPNKISAEIDFEINLITKPGANVAFVIILDTKRDEDRYVVLRDDQNGTYVWTTIEYREGFPGQIRAPLNLGSEFETGSTALIASETTHKIHTRVKKIDSIMDITEMDITINIYGTANNDGDNESIVKYVKLKFNQEEELPTGTVYQTKVDGKYTKRSSDREVMFSDFETVGQNGFFYRYPQDSLSIQHNYEGVQTKSWYTLNDATVNPLLIHTVRQMARSYGMAHDELRIGFDIDRIDPLATYAIRCRSEQRVLVNPENENLVDHRDRYITANIGRYLNNKRFVFVEGTVDYLRSHFSGKLAQKRIIDVSRTEYIYSYFEQGDIS